jgi:hypothetical protein
MLAATRARSSRTTPDGARQVTPIRRSVRASAVAALVLTALGLVHAVAVIAFIEGFKSGADFMGRVWSHLPITGIYFVMSMIGWFVGVAPEVPPPPSRIRGVLVAGLGIPILATLAVIVLDKTGVMSFDRYSAGPEDGLIRLSPALAYVVVAGGVGYWLIRRGDRARSTVARG